MKEVEAEKEAEYIYEHGIITSNMTGFDKILHDIKNLHLKTHESKFKYIQRIERAFKKGKALYKNTHAEFQCIVDSGHMLNASDVSHIWSKLQHVITLELKKLSFQIMINADVNINNLDLFPSSDNNQSYHITF